MRGLLSIALLVLAVSRPSVAVAQIVFNEYLAANAFGIEDEDGDHEDWIELYNAGPTGVDLAVYALSDDIGDPFRWTFPPVVVAPAGFLTIFASGKDRRVLPNLHTNFKLDPLGEPLALRNPGGQVVDGINTGAMVTDVSRGRSPDGGASWLFFVEPTPGQTNATAGYPGFVPDPSFSLPAGFYSGGATVGLSNALPHAVTYYTTDGGEPTTSSTLYTAPVNIDSTRVLRARSFAPGLAPSAIQTRTYLIDEQITFPVVSLTTDPPNLWDEDIGIYVFGREYNPYPPYYGANFWENWERPVHMEYFDVLGAPRFQLNAGVKIHGTWARSLPQKSLRILMRSAYGAEAIDYPLFEERENTRYECIVLSNAGQDWMLSMFRDAFCHRLAQSADLERLAYSPSIVFLNGDYWGIHNIRERPDENYLETYFGIDPDQVDILEDNQLVVEGDAAHYQQMISFIASHDLALDANYQVVQTMMETPNFAEYNVFEIYLNNQDWPWANIKYWRSRVPGGRWRWLYYDLDRTFGNYMINELERATDPNGPGGEFPWSTFLLVNLLKNAGFKQMFINTYADHLNTTFLPSNMLAHRDRFRSSLLPEVERHYARWEWPISTWYYHQSIIATFITERPAYARYHIMNKFGLPGVMTLSLDIDPPTTGRIKLAAIEIDSTWAGTYFQTVPIALTAVPNPGYAFAGWSDPNLPQEPSVTVQPTGDYAVTALFAPAEGGIVINEINYNSSPVFNPEDWVEFHNSSPVAIDISGWKFKDQDDTHVFVFPTGTSLAAGGYLVLCRDVALFDARFPGVPGRLGNMSFGLDASGELVRLYDAHDVLVDAVTYDDQPPWPQPPDGQGPTLELVDPHADNSLPASWAASIAPHGTPEALNSVASSTGVGEALPAPGIPARLELQGGYPNPFNPMTTFVLGIPARSRVRLSIHDAMGRLVKVLLDGPVEPGWRRATWDGRNDQGQPAAAGVYFTALKAGDDAIHRKIVLLK
jgi:hypothetical protein